MNNKRKLEMYGNVLILQMISMRDKTTGKYLPLMDGNVNSMLHRIHANLHKIEDVKIMFPSPDLCDTNQYMAFVKMLQVMFSGKVMLETFDFYGSDVGTTRKNLLNETFTVLERTKEPELDLIVSEFPIRFLNTEAKVVYNYNWSAVDDTNELLNESFIKEVIGSKYHETYLYSDIQYDYWKSKGVLSDNVFRSIEIFDKDLFMKIANEFHESAKESNNPEYQALKLISNLTSPVVFFPMRIDDQRYKFNEVLEYCEQTYRPLIITNPTNAPVPTAKNCTLINYSNTSNKRELYFHILKTLRSCDAIIHHESDMHISLLEHIAISKAKTIHEIQNINEYFANAK